MNGRRPGFLPSPPARAPEGQDLAGERGVQADYYRQALHRWLMRVAPGPSAGAPRALTPEETESLRALGYVN